MDAIAGGSENDEICLSRRILVGYYRECRSKKDDERMHYLCKKVENALRVSQLSSDVKSVLSKMIYTYKQKLEKSHKNFERCINSNKNWFETYVTFPVLVWQNPRPSSVRYCRPLRLQMVHETSEISKQEVANITSQTAELSLTANEEWSVKHDMKLTMVDGKVINALIDTSSAMRCYLCGVTSKDFNKLNICLKRPIINKQNLDYGISSLHAWIRFAECILHLAYKLKLAKWQARGARKKQIVAAEKKRIQNEFQEKLGLHVDKPRQGGGTSTDGNTARVIFQHSEEVSEITGVNLNIINRWHTILKLLSSLLQDSYRKIQTILPKNGFIIYNELSMV